LNAEDAEDSRRTRKMKGALRAHSFLRPLRILCALCVKSGSADPQSPKVKVDSARFSHNFEANQTKELRQAGAALLPMIQRPAWRVLCREPRIEHQNERSAPAIRPLAGARRAGVRSDVAARTQRLHKMPRRAAAFPGRCH